MCGRTCGRRVVVVAAFRCGLCSHTNATGAERRCRTRPTMRDVSGARR